MICNILDSIGSQEDNGSGRIDRFIKVEVYLFILLRIKAARLAERCVRDCIRFLKNSIREHVVLSPDDSTIVRKSNAKVSTCLKRLEQENSEQCEERENSFVQRETNIFCRYNPLKLLEFPLSYTNDSVSKFRTIN